MSVTFADPTPDACTLHVLEETELAGWLENQDSHVNSWIKSNGFEAKGGQVLIVPDSAGKSYSALVGLGSPASRGRGRFPGADARKKLPAGIWQLARGPKGPLLEEFSLGWLLAGYIFDRYKTKPPVQADLVAPSGIDRARIEVIAAGETLTRNLINTPASDMGPAELELAFRALGKKHKAKIHVTTGEALLQDNMPLIHAVGRASDREPRLLDLRWGNKGPALTLVGKGVCFDTGGLNLKPGASMGLMKKDMGGAATVMGLAHMIMALNFPLRLRVLVPAVENSVSDNAFRPQDVLTSRKGLTIEINNTDAEGRLVLADALALASEETPELLVSMATLTGAARVAVGPDIAPYYTDDDDLASALCAAAIRVADPVWRMPFHVPYEAMIEPDIADLDNAPKGGFAGSITAALFLRRFAQPTPRYAHFDIYGWQPTSLPGRPKGGAGQGARALLAALPELMGF